jgi:mandelate racemase/muconate lactonizing enzyme-like protein
MSDTTITAVRTTMLRVPWPQTPWLKGHAFGPMREFLLVDMETRGGICGLGYLFLFRPAMRTIAACLDECVIPRVIGKDASAVEAIWQDLWRSTVTYGRGGIAVMAMSALDIALWDVLGKAAKLPLHRLWGHFRAQLPAYGSGCFRGSGGDGMIAKALHYKEWTRRRCRSTRIISDKLLRMLGSNMPATATFLWDLNGLQRPLIPATPDINAAMGIPPRASFGIGDVDFTLLAKLEDSAVAKTAIPRSAVSHVMVAASTDQPGAPALVWTLEVTDPDGEITKVVADTKGIVTRVILPESRRPKIDWREPAALAGAIARIGATFGQNVKIASIVADERQGHITIDDPANGGQASTFEFSSDGVVRASISFSLDSMGPRFSVADLAPLNQEKIAALEADALRKLASSRQVYLESVTIGAHPFVSRAGAHAIEVRVRDIAEDSVRANYAWIVYDFGGRALDSSKF